MPIQRFAPMTKDFATFDWVAEGGSGQVSRRQRPATVQVQAPANIIRKRVTEIERPDWWPTDEEVRAAPRSEAAVTRG